MSMINHHSPLSLARLIPIAPQLVSPYMIIGLDHCQHEHHFPLTLQLPSYIFIMSPTRLNVLDIDNGTLLCVHIHTMVHTDIGLGG